MRLLKGGVGHLAQIIERDLADRKTGLSKPQREGLADIASSILVCRSVTTSELAAVLPRQGKTDESRFRYIHRWLSNQKIDPGKVMQHGISELVELLGEGGQTVVMMLDQTQICQGFEALVVSLRLKERALPIAWQVVQTQGTLGFNEQETLLTQLARQLPKSCNVLLAADRFYGTGALIKLCQQLGFSYRIRLKGNVTLTHAGGVLICNELLSLNLSGLEQAKLGEHDVYTNIGVIHEAGHAEPWIIAMDAKPGRAQVLDYGLRWGIEAMFSDLKSRGFNIAQTQLKTAVRIEGLLLANHSNDVGDIDRMGRKANPTL